MTLENKLGLTEAAELARAEEKLSKTAAGRLFEQGLLDTFPVGTFAGLAAIHAQLFGEVYAFAGQMRTVDKEAYVQAMERSPVNDAEIKVLLKQAMTDTVTDRTMYMKGIDASYHFESYHIFCTEDLCRR